LVTAHNDVGLPELFQTAVTAELAQSIVRRLQPEDAIVTEDEVAAALAADKPIRLTEVEGIYGQVADLNSLISLVRLDEIPGLINEKVISGGMIPKVECCVKAITGGTGSAHIIDGRTPHSILLEVFTDQGIGTMVVP